MQYRRCRSRRAIGLMLTLVLGLSSVGVAGPAFAFDGVSSAGDIPSPAEALRLGTQALRSGETAKALTSLQYAAEHGQTMAQWKLGRMYADGEGVPRSDLRAFEYFSRVANAHAEDNPGSSEARFVANAFDALGQYYLAGIPNSQVRANPSRAHEILFYAASYFGDADAQYHLARLYLDGKGFPPEPKQALRWLGLAANKGQYMAQATLGHMLVDGQAAPRQVARGLMWLTLARDGASGNEKWINEFYDAAVTQASDEERAMALTYLEHWLKTRREW